MSNVKYVKLVFQGHVDPKMLALLGLHLFRINGRRTETTPYVYRCKICKNM